MTRAEKLKLIKQKYPNYQDLLSQVELNDLLKDLDDPKKVDMFRKTGATRVMSGEVITPGKAAAAAGAAAVGAAKGAVKGAKAVTGLAKTVIPKKPSGGVDVKKLAKRGGILGLAGFAVGALGGGDEDTAATQQAIADQANTDLMMGMAQYEAAGGDVNALLNTAAGQQLMKNPNFNFGAIMGAGEVGTTASGVYTGKQETISSMPPQFAGGKPVEVKSDTISIAQWNKQFPMANPKALAEWKAKLVSAGVVSANAGIQELKNQWETWGKMSQDANRQGQKLTPYQLLDIQRGLWGGGADSGPSYSTQLIKTQNARDLYKQYFEQKTGRIIDDAEANEFAKFVRDKQLASPTKTEVKTVKGKKVAVTTPGFGEAEAAAEAEKRAMQDPLFAEFQTANVFGSALEKALGLRG
jgi:hypothetical protein